VVNNKKHEAMTVELKIVKPQHNAFVKCGDSLILQGALSGEPGKPLYYRWYSGFNMECSKEKLYSLNKDALLKLGADYTVKNISGMGSYSIALVASDVAEEKLEDYKYVLTAGGSDGQAPCVIHVLKASILAPKNNESIPHDKLLLKAEAPVLWTDEKYQKYNRLCFKWKICPDGEPLGRPEIYINPLSWLSFEPALKDTPSCIVYAPGNAIPAAAVGKYRIMLSVEDKEGTGDMVTGEITVTLS
jgi:hypothetical protein